MGLRRDVPLPDVNPDPLLNQRLGRTLFQQENELAQDESRCWGVVLSEIFISYRRADSRSEARSIYERMVRSYGVRKVFMDVEGIERGASFTKVLKQELERAKVLVAIIGPHWAGDGGDASTRLFDGADFVRTEIQIALHRKIPIIPILVNGALMPDKRLVPDCLHPLLSKNAATLTYNNFASDIGAVDRQISKWVRPLRKTYRVVSATAALVVMTSFAFYLYYASAGRNNTLVSIGDLSTIPSPDSELEWLKIKIERNFVDLFADNGVPVTHRSLGHPPVGRSSMRINGVVERLASGEVGVQILLEHPPYRVRSVSHNAPLELWTEAYKSIPAAILFAVDIDPKTTQPKASSKRTSMSFKASLLYLEAVRLAKAPQLMRALALIERAIAEDEKFAVAYWVKAQILRGLGRESEAATVESIATSIDPDHARPIIVGEPTKPLPSLFQRLQHTDWTHIERGMLYKRVEQESYGITLHAWSFLLDAYHLGVVMASNPLGATASEFRKETGSTLAVNGGFFAIDRASRLTPTGLVVSEGKMISSPSDPRRGGSGVVFNRDGIVGIDFVRLFTSDGISAAVQVGPLVVDPGGKNGIRANDFDRQDRSAICLSGQTDFKIVVVVGGISLFELGGILSAAEPNGGFGCERALNLDGGPSTQVSFQSKGHTVDIPGRWKISNGLVVSRK